MSSPEKDGVHRKGMASRKSRSIAVCLIAILTFTACLAHSVFSARNPAAPRELTEAEASVLEKTLDVSFPERRLLVSPLPYDTVPADLSINARSAIIIDYGTGSILFEKNADEVIPPASMTKLVEMYVVFQAVESGEVSLDDEVHLPPQSWSINLPDDASRMFLAEGQHVTLDELLLGLAIASGNDASVAVAYHVCGNMQDFVDRMNSVVKNLGLMRTHFVESSGYSEENVTTAREFAAFCREYIRRFPFAMERYHSQRVLRYPQEHNLPDFQKGKGVSQEIVQHNTNKLLGDLPGCDGLKTGFIYESGYNIALTAVRYGTRFISVTMGGPGNGSQEGNKFRVQDGTVLMEYAFSGFADYHAPTGERAHSFTVALAGAKEKSVRLVPAFDETLTVPFITSDSPGGAASSVTARAYVPDIILGNVECGKAYGTITYSIDGTVLRSMPLVADRTVRESGPAARAWGRLVKASVTALNRVR